MLDARDKETITLGCVAAHAAPALRELLSVFSALSAPLRACVAYHTAGD